MFRQTYGDQVNVYSVYMFHKYVNSHEMEVTDLPLSKIKNIREWKIWGTWHVDPALSEHWSVNDVLSDPKKYSRDYENMLKADLSYPIIAVQTPLDTYLILDGNHRHGKAILQKKTTIKAYIFTDPALLKKFKLGKQTHAIWEKISAMEKADFDALYKKRFHT